MRTASQDVLCSSVIPTLATADAGTAAIFVHPAALCESERVGSGTRVWAHAHIMNGAVIGTDCNVCDQVFVESGVIVGDRVTIKNRALLFEGVTVGDDAFIGPGVMFTNDRYPRSARMPELRGHYKSKEDWLVHTQVGRGVSIGAGAIIICGVHIGAFAMIGAGAVVTKDVPAHRLVVGQPARAVGWACTCGSPLRETLNCTHCDRAFEMDNEELVETSHVGI